MSIIADGFYSRGKSYFNCKRIEKFPYRPSFSVIEKDDQILLAIYNTEYKYGVSVFYNSVLYRLALEDDCKYREFTSCKEWLYSAYSFLFIGVDNYEFVGPIPIDIILCVINKNECSYEILFTGNGYLSLNENIEEIIEINGQCHNADLFKTLGNDKEAFDAHCSQYFKTYNGYLHKGDRLSMASIGLNSYKSDSCEFDKDKLVKVFMVRDGSNKHHAKIKLYGLDMALRHNELDYVGITDAYNPEHANILSVKCV